MSKKHFIALAGVIRHYNKGDVGPTSVPFNEDAIAILADFCKAMNRNFKRDRWLGYIAGECGPNGGRVKVAA